MKQYQLQYNSGQGWKDSGIKGSDFIVLVIQAEHRRSTKPKDDMRIVSHAEGDILPESKIKLWEVEAEMKLGEPLRMVKKVAR